jgi:hypothetical protein
MMKPGESNSELPKMDEALKAIENGVLRKQEAGAYRRRNIMSENREKQTGKRTPPRSAWGKLCEEAVGALPPKRKARRR